MGNNQNKTQGHAILTLFTSMLYISAFTFGGGFVIVSLMKKKFVDELGWLSEEEMLDYTALAQSSPGAIAVNAAILVGWRIGGLAGMAAAVLGTILPPIAILMVVSMCYDAFATNPLVATVLMGMQAGVAAVIMDVVFSLGGNVLRERNALHIGMMAAAFVAACILKVNVIVIVLAAAALGITVQMIERRKRA